MDRSSNGRPKQCANGCRKRGREGGREKKVKRRGMMDLRSECSATTCSDTSHTCRGESLQVTSWLVLVSSHNRKMPRSVRDMVLLPRSLHHLVSVSAGVQEGGSPDRAMR
eukprot:327850-Hanusia_phi.AAC.3